MNQYVLAGMFYFFLALVLIMIATSPSKSHSWYSYECCNDNDCAPAKLTQIENTSMYKVQSIKGSVIIDMKKMKCLPSQDNDYHICLYRR